MALLFHVDRIRKVEEDEISEKTQSQQPQPTQELGGQVKDEEWQAVDRNVLVKVGTSELKEVERAVRSCTGLKL
jgi:hypothetical protein